MERLHQGGLRILFADDEAHLRDLMQMELPRMGHEVTVCPDGAAALKALEKGSYDAALLDMRMPRCDGPQTLAQIRRDPRFVGMKVFAISGTTPEDAGLKVGPQGVDAWFQKPLNPRQLWEVMQQCLNRPAPN